MNTALFRFMLVFAGLAFMVGCSTIRTTYTPLINQTTTAKPSEKVRVFNTTLPDIPYEEIGMIEVEGNRNDSASSLILALRQKAAENGADGVIIQEMTERNRGIVPIGGMFVPVQKKLFRGTAIRFKD